MLASEYEWETRPALEGEWEFELEGELEGEEFFGRLLSLGRRALPGLRRIGLQAARSALTGGGRQLGQEVGARMGDGWGSRLADLGGDLGTWLGGRLPQQEFEFEGEWEWERPAFSASSPIAARALMEHIGHAAATARTDREAEAFLPALVPLATQLLPRLAPRLLQAAPRLTRGLSGIVRSLRSRPGTRPLVRTVPSIVGRTVQSLGQQAARGRPVTPQAAAQTLARQTSRVLGDPRQALQAWRRSQALDRRYHQTYGAGHPRLPGAADQPDLSDFSDLQDGMPDMPDQTYGMEPYY